ncbi:hypothetical protein [Mucilaginibacter gynuensis]|uniref:hypothetical protein n=1 Tax=Mucilaginibacter gynuensis TaxID=1302236 RepID=UPI0031EF7002
MQLPTEIDQSTENQRQALISRILIGGVLIMVIVFLNCTNNTEDDMLLQGALLSPVITVLLAIYTFTYRGKAHLAARILFFIFLILSIISLGILYYVAGLAKAFQH